MKTTTTSRSSASLPAKKTLHLQIEGKTRRIDLSWDQENDVLQAVLDGRSMEGTARLLQPGVLSLILHGRTFQCLEGPTSTTVTVNRQRFSSEIRDPRSLAARRQERGIDGGEQTVKAPMPGRIVRVLVEPGQQVAAQQPLVAIEAMKMQNELKAIGAGKVKELRVSVGQTVVAAEILVVLS